MGAPQSTEPQDGLTSEELVRQELIEPAEDIEPFNPLSQVDQELPVPKNKKLLKMSVERILGPVC